MDVSILDTTFRDGSQSLWASGIRYGMMDALAEDLDHVGFSCIEVPANSIFFKKMVRDLKENPWDVMRMLAGRIRNTPKSCMGVPWGNLNSFGAPTPPVLGDLFARKLVEIGIVNRAQLVCNTADQLTRNFPSDIPKLREVGMDVALAVSYTISPRHTDEYYAEKTRLAAGYKPDAIYLKDQGGLLTVDRIRTLLPAIIAQANGIPIEIHSHCTTGLAPLVYLESLDLGAQTLHCGIPPLADGSAQPSVFSMAHNARALGHSLSLDEPLLESVSARLGSFARQEGLPIGRPLAYDADQYKHQVPGGVISNLKFQLKGLGIEHRLHEVLEECIDVRRDLGYPIMITPFSQYVCTQAAIHVATGARYEVVIDPLIRLAQGAFGEDSGYRWMDQDLKDEFLSLPRANELAGLHEKAADEVSLSQAREMYGGPGISDEDLLLRAIMQGAGDVDAMHAAGPPRGFGSESMPLASLIESLRDARKVRYVQIRSEEDSVRFGTRSAETVRQ